MAENFFKKALSLSYPWYRMILPTRERLVMIDPSFDGEVATISPYPPTIQELEQTVEDLHVEINRLNIQIENLETESAYWRDRYSTRGGQIENLESYIKENFDYIDENVVQNLVDIFALEITRDYDVTVTVTFSGTVSVPLNFDMDDLENSLDARLEFSYYADGTADFMEDRMEIDWSES